jgi:hypothetical protein
MLECRDIDGLMMDWLYEELEPARHQEVSQHIDGCTRCAAELSGFQRARSAFRELATDEPSAAVSAILLHEAARRAPARARAAAAGEGGLAGWLGNLFGAMFAHPGLAAAASLVLVAGVAGTLYLRKGDDMMARPSAEVARTAPAGGAASTAAAGAEAPDQAAPTAAGAADDFVAFAPPAELEPSADPARREVAAEQAGRSAELLDEQRADALKKKAARAEKGDLERKLAVTDRSRQPVASVTSGADPLIASDEEANARGAFSSAVGDAPTSRGRGGADVAQKPTDKGVAPPPGGRAQTGGAAPADADAERGAFRPYRESDVRDGKDAGWLREQEASLGAAVKQKRCRDAAAIANDILDRDPEYYTARLAGSKEVADCRWYVSDERKRRVESRKKATSSTGAGGKATKAAPAKSEAAATDSK